MFPHPTSNKEENSHNKEVFYKQNMSSFHKLLIPLIMFNSTILAWRMYQILSASRDRKPSSNGLGIKKMYPLTELEVQKQGQAQGLVDSAVPLCHLGLRLFLLLGSAIMEGWLHHLAVSKMAASFWPSFCYGNIQMEKKDNLSLCNSWSPFRAHWFFLLSSQILVNFSNF